MAKAGIAMLAADGDAGAMVTRLAHRPVAEQGDRVPRTAIT
jgi:hypothetical protein